MDDSSPDDRPLEFCSLSADGLAERLAWVRAEILPAAVGATRLDDGVALELRNGPGLAATLDRLIELERACCSGLVFSHGPSTLAGQRRLEIHGVDPDASVFASLWRDDTNATLRRRPSVLGALGIGAAASLTLCCILPLTLTATVGTAAWLGRLDDPWVIGAVAVALGGGLHLYRQRATRVEPTSCC